MRQDDPDVKVSLWLALGKQPGVSAWFVVWMSSRRNHVKQKRVAQRRRLQQGCTA
jgi:hypothetical protein